MFFDWRKIKIIRVGIGKSAFNLFYLNYFEQNLPNLSIFGFFTFYTQSTQYLLFLWALYQPDPKYFYFPTK